MSEEAGRANDPDEQVIADFERLWLSPSSPSIGEFISNRLVEGNDSNHLLAELCIVDMEFRWRSDQGAAVLQDDLGSCPTLQDYEAQFANSQGLAFGVSQLAEEYRVRRLWGDKPSPDQFLAESAMPNATMLQAIKDIDRQLANDDIGTDHFAATAKRTPAIDPRAPLPFADYVLHEMIGAGGIGKVYRATQRSLERDVAVKTLAKSIQHDPIAVDRFVGEARTLARLRHANIVGVHGLGQYPGGGYFLVMDFIPGNTLEQWQRSAEFSSHQAIEIVRKLAAAVDYAHTQGIIHCDLKPSNVLLANDNEPIVSDFGFAEFWQEIHRNSSSDIDRRGGTFGFTAPEWLDDPTIQPDPTIDVYSLGAVLAYLLRASETKDHAIAEVCGKARSIEPSDRYQSACEFGKAIRSAGSFGVAPDWEQT